MKIWIISTKAIHVNAEDKSKIRLHKNHINNLIRSNRNNNNEGDPHGGIFPTQYPSIKQQSH